MNTNDNTYLEKTAMRGWEFLTGDINFQQYGGSWFRRIGPARIYHVIELVNTTDKSQYTYSVQLKEIDLDNVLEGRLEAALSCFGMGEFLQSDIRDVDALASYGVFAYMGDWAGNDYTDLLREAKRESRRLEKDSDYHESQSERPVNRIGSTARELAQGDFDSALIRGVAKGDRLARLVGKIRGWSQEDMDSIGPEHSDLGKN